MAVRLLRVKDGCCCSLRTCCYVQGFSMLLYNIAAALLSILAAHHTNTSEYEIFMWLPQLRYWTLTVLICMAIFYVLAAPATAVFLRGIFTKRPFLLFCYIKSISVHLSFTVFTTSWALGDPSSRYPLIIHDLVKWILFSYMYVCANSLFAEMLLESESTPEVERTERHTGHLYAAPSGSAFPAPPAYSKVYQADPCSDL